MKVKHLIGIVCLMTCMVLPTAIFAQDYAPVEIFGGLSTMRVGDWKIDGNTIPDSGGGMTGWGASVAFNINPSWAIKADMSGLYAKVEESDESAKRYNILGGVQYNIRQYEPINIFVEGLAGFTNYAEGDDSLKGLGLAFGGGVDWNITDKFAWRVAQAGYTFASLGNNDLFGDNKMKSSGFRFQTGILIFLGK